MVTEDEVVLAFAFYLNEYKNIRFPRSVSRGNQSVESDGSYYKAATIREFDSLVAH